MGEHPPTSIKIGYDIKDDDSTLASKKWSHKSTVVTPHKKDNTVYHNLTKLLYRRAPKYHPINNTIPKLIKLLKILNKRFKNLKHKKIKITHMIVLKLLTTHQKILLTRRMIQVQAAMKMLLMKNQDINM